MHAQSASQPAATASNTTPGSSLPLAPLKRDFKGSFPIAPGERHEYEVRFSRFPIYATVGVITFEFLGLKSAGQMEPFLKQTQSAFSPGADEQFVHLRGSAASKGILTALFGVDVKDTYESLIDPRDFSARLSYKEIKESKKRVRQFSLFDPLQQTIAFTATDLNQPQTPPREKNLERKDGMLDVLSSFYFVRMQKLKEGQLLRFPVNDDDANYEFEIVIGKREKLATDCGKVKTIRLEPKLFGPGKLFSRQGEMTMWATDDNKHTILRAIAKTSSGTISVKLTNFKNNCKIIEPDPEEKESKKIAND